MFRTISDPNYVPSDLFKVDFQQYHTYVAGKLPHHVQRKVVRPCFEHFEDHKAWRAWRKETFQLIKQDMKDRKLKVHAVNDLNRIVKKHPELAGALYVMTFCYL